MLAMITCKNYPVAKMGRFHKYQTQQYTHTHTLQHCTHNRWLKLKFPFFLQRLLQVHLSDQNALTASDRHASLTVGEIAVSATGDNWQSVNQPNSPSAKITFRDASKCPAAARRTSDLQPKLVQLTDPGRMKSSVGHSKCELLTYSRLLRAGKWHRRYLNL
jgi:hypothetical protein